MAVSIPTMKVAPKKKEQSPLTIFVIILLAGAMLTQLILALLLKVAYGDLLRIEGVMTWILVIGSKDYSINPIISFLFVDLFLGFIVAIWVGFMIRIPYLVDRVKRTREEVVNRLHLQLGRPIEEVKKIVSMGFDSLDKSDSSINYENIKAEIEDINKVDRWLVSRQGSWMSGLEFYMKYHFTHNYANKVQGFAYGGAALLIILIGLRGIKFIPAESPSLILGGLFLEFSLLTLLAITLYFTEDEERTDKILKQMVEAVKGPKAPIDPAKQALAGADQLSRTDLERIVRESMDKKIAGLIANRGEDELRKLALDLIAPKEGK